MSEIITRVNKIYYLDNNGNIQETTVYQYDKLKVLEAEDFLSSELGQEYPEVIKVLIQDVIIFIPNEDLEKYDLVELTKK